MKKNNCVIVPLSTEYNTVFDALVKEYLPGSDIQCIHQKVDEGDGIALLALEQDTVLGCVYGWATPRENEYVLDGIAVEYHHWRAGIGTALLCAFETKVKQRGYTLISLGSADGFVETFYISNGYQPSCYKIYREDEIVTVCSFSDMESYFSYQRPETDGFVVMEKRCLLDL